MNFIEIEFTSDPTSTNKRIPENSILFMEQKFYLTDFFQFCTPIKKFSFGKNNFLIVIILMNCFPISKINDNLILVSLKLHLNITMKLLGTFF